MIFCFKTPTIFLLLCIISNPCLPAAATSPASHVDTLANSDEMICVGNIPLNMCAFDQINITTGYLILSQRRPADQENLFIGAQDQAAAEKASGPAALKILDGCLYLSVEGGVKTDLRNKLGYRLGLARTLKTIIISGHAKLKIQGYFDNIQDLAIYICGKGSVEIDQLFAPNLTVTIAGRGNILIHHLNCNNLSAAITGNGSITVEQGIIEKQHVRISGQGEINTSRIMSKNGDIGITGKGKVTVSVSNYLLAMSDSDESIFNTINCRYTEIKPSIRGFCPPRSQLLEPTSIDKIEDAIAEKLFIYH